MWRALGGDDAVDVCLNSCEVGRLGTGVAVIFDPVAAGGDADATWVLFLGAIRRNSAHVRRFLVTRDLGDGDEVHVVGAGRHSLMALA